MRNIPDNIPASAFREHVSGGEPQGSPVEDRGPVPDPDEWRDGAGDDVDVVEVSDRGE